MNSSMQLVALSLLCLCSVWPSMAQSETELFGAWQGESICQVKNSPCQDEQVIYHIRQGRDAAHVRVSADKIVAGKAINMGMIEFNYDAQTGRLTSDAHGHWEFMVKKHRMVGTLTLPDQTIYRRVTLVKEP